MTTVPQRYRQMTCHGNSVLYVALHSENVTIKGSARLKQDADVLIYILSIPQL